ncbi:hypothetical protein THASP1DRAFT_29804 [Thamnocephalis sphaerospora]|uniref:Uncharacterized protein n=1 Tax=Thamnocephalis sphaerospora TaxID=78915 RepID=A0A4V1IWQ7_9FUNG|nr:hypothetical protein THASP1DRAFT_29804 [Thamnocephalis sphaerospora]|eukprot:RKP08399.1 hypothetical protein THASP1DRAFT_29804 [Thamnocephalis sphaerospora]
MADGTDTLCLNVDIDVIMEHERYGSEGHQELKRSSGVITPDAKEFCTKKHGGYKEEDYSSDEDPAERSRRQRHQHQHQQQQPRPSSTQAQSIETARPSASSSHKAADVPAGLAAPVAITAAGPVDLTGAGQSASLATSVMETAHDDASIEDDDDASGEDRVMSRPVSAVPTEILGADSDAEDSFCTAPDDSEEANHDSTSRLLPAQFFPPVVIVRDFAYPPDDPRHHGKRVHQEFSRLSVTDASFFGMPAEADDADQAANPADALLAAFHATYGGQWPAENDVESSSVAPPAHVDSASEDPQDEYTGPAKAICDFAAEDPADIQFKAGEECWVRYQSQQGILVAHKDGRDCLVREKYLEFTNRA